MSKALDKMSFESFLGVWSGGDPVEAEMRELLHAFYLCGKQRGACELAEKAPFQLLQGAVLDHLVDGIVKDRT